MNIKRIAVFAVLSAFFLLPARANTLAPEEPAIVQAAQKRPQRGVLYRIRHQDSIAYLFGTIHVGKPDFFPLNKEVTEALSRSSTLAVEMDVRKQERFMSALNRYAMYPPGESIERRLDPQSLRKLKHTLARFGIGFENIARMKPWIIANLLVSADIERHGFLLRQGIDLHLLSLAGKKTVLELESAEHQLALFDSMAVANQEAYLIETLERIDSGEGMEQAQALVDAWARADSAAIEAFLQKELEDKTITSMFLEQVLLDRRHPPMADKIESLLKNGGTVFIAVGMLHLVGEKGLPAMLRQRGYRVEKMY